ncbi:MAG: lamin tail domain-containing protein [Verrucomicrobia bacterium]|nr:lamin tail domain-containing protein [Verrucomicrobiota bacterium]
MLVQFRERVDAVTANQSGNYAITNLSGAIAVSGAQLDASGSNVVLSVSPMVDGAAYVLVVNGVLDGCTRQNAIQPNSTVSFSALSLTSTAIGNPQPAGAVTSVAGGVDISAGGRDIGGTNDQFQFSYQLRTGDFDVKVRVTSLSLSDAWAEAGLIAREDANGGGRFASVMATPSISGSYFQYRDTVNAAAALAGSYPVNFPNTWLRLRRTGNQFTGYASLDGQSWRQLGTVAIAMPATISLGFGVSSHNTNQSATAAFRDFGNVTAPTIAGPLPFEPRGQSSRRTSLVISEIMFNPPARTDGRNLEFVELFNALGEPQDISGYRLDGAADFKFPAGTVLAPGAFLVVARNPADVEAVYGITGVLGPFSNTNNLPNNSGTIQLRHRTGAVFLEANYDTQPPWPVSADGAGHSLVLARPSYGEGNIQAWAASDAVGGSPGRMDPFTAEPSRNVMINEFLANTDEPELDFIELYNHSNLAVDISGCFLSDARDTNKFTIPVGTILPPRGFIVFNQTQLGFSLSSGGERIYFRNSSNTRVVDAVRFEAQARGVSTGRFPDGSPGFAELSTKTPGTTNSRLLLRDIVINEIMYNPISRDSDDEFIELFNRGTNAVNLGGWRLQDAVTLTIPSGATVPAGGYLVLARNASRLISRYPNLSSGNTVGDYNGSLDNGGERIALAMPEPVFTTNGAVIVTNFNYVVVDEVTYRDGGRWGRWSDGGGSSLELVDARGDNRLAANWADSDESAKAPWTTVEVRGVLDNGTSTADQLQVFLQGAGECLIDDVEVRTMAGVNLIANSTFEGGATGWTAEGTQEQSSLETSEGFNSSQSYHIRAVTRGDNQMNRIRTPLTANQSANQTNIIRAKVRWLRGHPEVLFRLRGNWLEAAVKMDLPTNLGSPGAMNSHSGNMTPAIYDVMHFPSVPSANEPVVVTARAQDPDSIISVQLKYRVDPSGAALIAVPMYDDGANGDSVAGDGLYSAVIPGQPANTLVAFRVQATDGSPRGLTATFPHDAPIRECLVRFGESVPTGNFPSYRMWMTQATFNTWDTRNNLNNSMNDVTFVLGNHRVIYNTEAVYAGSPYISPSFNTPTGNRCGYSIDFPADEPFLGDNGLNLDWPGGHGNENTAIQEQMAYWIADQMNVAFSHRYFIRLAVNGVTDMQRGGVFEAALQPGGDFLEQWSPGDSDGDFFRIDRAFEFNDTGGLTADPEPQLRVYSTPDLAAGGGVKKKTEKYRWFWLKRSFETANDYTNVFAVADALNTTGPEPYTSHTEALVDVQQWMGIFAAEHIINNFDSWGHDIGKNMYMYFPENGRAQVYMFDLDWLMLVAAGSYPANPGASSAQLFVCDDPAVARMYAHPPFRRAYYRAVQSAVSNAFVPAKFEALMDAKYASLVANGITLCDGQNLAAPTAVKTWFNQRRTYLMNQLTAVAAGFSITNNGGNDLTVGTNLITLSGTAPIGVAGILVNGAEYPLTWTTLTNWSMRLWLPSGESVFNLAAYDESGNVLSNLTDTIRITSTSTPETPEGRVVINEIMYNPTLPDAEFVELHNTSTTTPFDVSGWRLNGVDYTFPPGSIIDPRGYRLVAKDIVSLISAYGSNVPPAGVFGGQLDDGGETVSLIRPGTTPGEDTVMDSVTFDDDAPWPAKADGGGSSLQLIDANQDNARVANWSDGSGWRFYSFTGVPGVNATNLTLFMAAAGSVHIDNVTLVEERFPAWV